MIKRRDFHHKCLGCGRKEQVVVTCQCVYPEAHREACDDYNKGGSPKTIFVMPCHGHPENANTRLS